jgi:hypothetical protein
MSLMDKLREAMRTWLYIEPGRDQGAITITQPLSFDAHVLRNRMWYRGDPSELEDFFKQCASDSASRSRFWAAIPDVPLRKIHVDIATQMVDRLAGIIAGDMEGFEIPDRDGVGLARKIGLDRALSVLDMDRGHPSFLVCLDADSRVDPGYLSAAGAFFARGDAPGAVIEFAHQEAEDPVLQEAILRYELFLRAYVLGLRWAGSPYAFHTVGSTIACTGEAYAAVRGMSRRRAGEDFYFLNKLAKLGPVGRIGGTVVRPSPRPSLRVPFGTGRRMARVLSGEESAAGSLYAPEIFRILREWIRLAEESPDRPGDARLAEARRIHPALGRFLEEQAFPGAWEKIRRQAPGPAHLRRQFHGWFDAFRTLRAVHALRDGGLPNVPLLEGVERLLQWTGCPDAAGRREETGKAASVELLTVLREKDREASETRCFLP